MPDDKKPDVKPDVKPSVPEAGPTDSYWLVLVTDAMDTPPKCIRCENSESLKRAIEENVLKATAMLHAYGFKGQRIEISAPRPVCSFKVGDEKIDVGYDNAEYDEGGCIMPLSKPETGE